MSVKITGIVILLLAWLPMSARGAELHSAVVLNTGPYTTDGTVKPTPTPQGAFGPQGFTEWSPPASGVWIKGIKLWQGVGYGSIVDHVTFVFRASNAELLTMYGQDAYAPGRGPIAENEDYGPNGFFLAGHDALSIHWSCVRVGGVAPGWCHNLVIIRYSLEP